MAVFVLDRKKKPLVRNTDGTADCVGDFTHHADALAFAAAIERGEVEV